MNALPVRHRTYLRGRDFPAMARALAEMGIVPEEPGARFHSHESPADGWPIDFVAVDPSTGLKVGLYAEEPPNETFEVAQRLRLEVEEGSGAGPAASTLFRKILNQLEEERRLECAGAEHFLGKPDDFGWTSETYPAPLLPGIHAFIDQRLEGWRRIKTARPHRNRAISRVLFREEDGRKVAYYSNVRYFMRKDSAWLVLEVSTDDGLTEIDLASTGTPDGWAESFLDGLSQSLRGGSSLAGRKMLANGRDLSMDRTYTWDDLFLDPSTKDNLLDETVRFFNRRELYAKMDLPFRRGILLHGPPGTGKTLVGRILASSLEGKTFIWVTAGQISGSRTIEAIFDMARYSKDVVLFFEDLDFYASRRDSATFHGDPSILGELLVQLDGLASNDGLLVMATTNDLEAIEPALKDRPSRFDRIIEVRPAPADIRAQHLLKLLAKHGVTGEQVAEILDRTEGFSGAQIQELAVRARLHAAERGVLQISLADLQQAAKVAREYKSSPKLGFG